MANTQHQRAKSTNKITKKTQQSVSSKDKEIENLKKRDTAIKTKDHLHQEAKQT